MGPGSLDKPRRQNRLPLLKNTISAAILLLTLVACDSGSPPGHPQTGDVSQAPLSGTPASTEQATRPARASSAPSAAALAHGAFRVEVSDTHAAVLANDANEKDVLNALAAQSGFAVNDAGVTWKNVTLDIQAPTVHALLVQLLKTRPYQIIYEYDRKRNADALTRVVIGQQRRAVTGRRRDTGDMALKRVIAKQSTAAAGSDSAGISQQEQQQIFLNQLLDPSAQRRVEAAEDIDPTGSALEYLPQVLLTDPSPEVRSAAAETLAESDDPRAVDALISALGDQDTSVLVAVIDALGFAGNKQTITHLQPFLEHPDADVRDAAEAAIELLE